MISLIVMKATTILVLMMVMTTVTACGGGGDTTNNYYTTPSNLPPEFKDCPTDDVLTASSGTTTATATWKTPSATDPDGTAPTVTQQQGPASGSVFDEGNTAISYKARDSNGLSDFCYFTVRVKVVYCPDPTPLLNGKQTCSKKNIDGSVCTHSCHLGYELLGPYSVQCNRTAGSGIGSWDTDFPTCEPVSCGDPGSVAGGHLECPSDYTYTQMCVVTCNPGYRNSASSFIRCTATRSWTTAYPCTDAEPPKFPSGCPARQVLYTGPLETPVALTWRDPVTTDNSGKIVTLVGDPPNGTLAGPGVTVVTLTATDSIGNSASCFFFVSVEARECPALSPSYRGRVTCSRRFVEGSQCTVTCEEGYRPSGNDTLTCLASETWDLPMPTCEAVLCPDPPNVDHRRFVCMRGRQFREECNLGCDSGFVARPPYSIQCLANATWTTSGDCADVEPPVFPNGCPDNIDDYAQPLAHPTSIKWDPPVVTDNSGLPIQLTSDAPWNNSFAVGETRVTYTATDVTGNSRMCHFKVTINTLQCSAPDLEPANRTVTLMTYSCPSGLVYGATCTLACLQGYPLVGPGEITCVRDDTTYPPTMFWDWSGPSANKPKCSPTDCPKLDAPTNGALACNLGNFGWDCLMSCQNGWDIPARLSAGGHFYCTNGNGFWTPSKVPGCATKLRPIDVRLMSDVFYYTGSCNASMDELRANFVDRMNNSTWKDACVGTCFVENIQVTCGPVSGRKKKSTQQTANSIIIIKFEISVGNTAFETVENITAVKSGIASALYSDANNGHFNIGSLQADENNFRAPTIGVQCLPGYLYVDTNPNLSCAGCGTGYYVRVGSTECQPCPVGSYTDLDNATSCTPCPPGQSTIRRGSTKSTDCKELCTAGTSSYNGFVPCQACAPGSYQSTGEATFCDLCPAGSWTVGGSATSVTQCQPADVSLFNSSLAVSVMEGQYTSGLTISVWVKPLQAADVNVSFQSLSTLTTPAADKWSHVVVTVDSSGRMTVLLQNSEVFSGNLDQTLSAVSSSSLRLGVPEGTVLVSGFRAWDKVLSEGERAEASLSCTGNTTSNILTWSPPSSTVLLPSVCDAVDECEGSPCGTHPCENQVGRFACRCLGGWTGVTCTTPPDPCLSHLCRHGATCLTDGASNYTCVCPAGYSGELCDLFPVAGNWGVWATWENCSASCGEGVRRRQRYCDNPTPRYGGEDCDGEDTETQGCNGVLCVPANVTWGEWGQLGDCSVTCGGGMRTRQRSCTEGDKQNATGCVGAHDEEEVCATSLCPEHGGWSEWADRSPCSVTCGTGQKSRERTCTNPLPANGGNPCSGNATTTSTCSMAPCRVCPTLKRSTGTLLRCEKWESLHLKVCNLTCAPGYASPSEPFPGYICGEKTNFLWSHQVDGQFDDELPSCNTPSFPPNGTLTQSVTMNTDCDPGTAYEVQKNVTSNIQSAVPCNTSHDCHMQVTTNCSNGGTNRKKKDTGSLIVHLKMTLVFSGFLHASANDTTSAQKFTELIQLADMWVAVVARNDTENLFTVNIGGVEIKPNLESVTYTTSVYCPPGTVQQRGFCVSCPSGYKEEAGKCVPCPLGQYQDQPASTVCKDCPGGTTWHLLGAISSTQCIVPLNTPHGTQENSDDTPLSHTTVIIIAVTVCGTVLLFAVVAAVAIYKNKQLNLLRYTNPNTVHDLPPTYNEAARQQPVMKGAWGDTTPSASSTATMELKHRHSSPVPGP